MAEMELERGFAKKSLREADTGNMEMRIIAFHAISIKRN